MIPVSEPKIGEEEVTNALDAIRSGFISGTTGKYIKKFEEAFSDYCNVKHGVSTTSGTTALHLAAEALEIGTEDEVIVPELTNAATVFSVIYSNATPITVDCDPETLGMDTEEVKEKITPRTKAIMPVHLYGHPVDMDPILEIAEDFNLYIIEDAAEAHGAKYKNHKVGSLGDVGAFSFYANKIITTGEGGMIITNSDDVEERARLLRNLAFDPSKRFRHNFIGFNYRMTNIQAAIGLAQLNKIESFIKRKREIARRYNEHFKNTQNLTLPPEKNWAKNVYWMYPLLVRENSPVSRDELRKRLENEGIETRAFFIPMSNQPAFIKRGLFDNINHPVAEDLSERGLYLPSGVGLNDEQIDQIAGNINKIVQK